MSRALTCRKKTRRSARKDSFKKTKKGRLSRRKQGGRLRNGRFFPQKITKCKRELTEESKDRLKKTNKLEISTKKRLIPTYDIEKEGVKVKPVFVYHNQNYKDMRLSKRIQRTRGFIRKNC